MAVNLPEPDQLLPVPGVRLGTAAAGIRYRNRSDLLLMAFAPGTQGACLFTRNAFRAAPVQVAEGHLGQTPPRYALINAGNANAGTGEAGLAHAQETCALVAEAAACRLEEVLPFSTGVIGEPLPLEPFRRGIPAALAALGEDRWLEAARTIMTTDTVPKGCSRQLEWDGRTVTITGIAKGSGMIRPDLATMLVFIATDAAIEAPALRALLAAVVAESFHCITVDGDTSTNDACLLVATGQSDLRLEPGHPAYGRFRTALGQVCTTLAQAIVRDGEGATKLMTIEVSGGRDVAECRQVGFTVAHSPLVKTAFYASDPNWGRILAAVGRAGLADLALERITIDLDEVRIVSHGGRDAAYREEDGQRVMAREEITVRIGLGRGEASARVWTTDLSHEYVRINAEYRT